MNLSLAPTRDSSFLFPELNELDTINSAPSYSSAIHREPCTHVFSERLSSNCKISLCLKSMASSSSSVPLFYDGSSVKGTVYLDHNKSVSGRELLVKIRGRATSAYQPPGPQIEDVTFLKLGTTLWPDSSNKLSRSKSMAPSEDGSSWSFSLPLPDTVEVDGVSYPLPPSYAEKAYITYSIQVLFMRDLLHSNIALTTTFRFLPRTRPGENSAMASTALLQGTPTPGPHVDPLGWSESGFTVLGRLNKERDVSVYCQIALGAPLEYAQGSLIPFYLSAAGNNPQAVSILSNPQNWSLSLVRCTRLGQLNSAPSIEDFSAISSSILVEAVAPGRGWLHNDETSGYAVQGEIGVPRGATASFNFHNIAVQYAIRICPSVKGFKLQTSKPHYVSVTIMASRSRSAIAGMLAGTVQPEMGPVPSYNERFRMPRVNQLLMPK